MIDIDLRMYVSTVSVNQLCNPFLMPSAGYVRSSSFACAALGGLAVGSCWLYWRCEEWSAGWQSTAKLLPEAIYH